MIERLVPATPVTPQARLRIEQLATVDGVGTIVPVERYAVESSAYVIPLDQRPTHVVLRNVP